MLRPDQRTERLLRRIEELGHWTVIRSEPLNTWRFNGAPLAMRAPWPTRDGVARFEHDEVRIGSHWRLERTRLELDLGGEGLVRIAFADGISETFGLDPNHRRLPLRSHRFSVRADCVARHPFGVPNREAALQCARLIELDEELEDFILLLRQVAELSRELGPHDAVPPMLSAAEEALRELRWPSATAAYLSRMAPGQEMQRIWSLPPGLDPAPPGLDDAARASVVAARDQLAARLRWIQDGHPREGALGLTGHAHIDLAWLWPIEETRRKARRTFHTVLSLMERHSGFLFNQSTAQLYAFLEEDDPELFDRISARVRDGQWEPTGGMWVEPDTNMPTGESLVRQLLYGQRYFESRFGKRHDVCWLPDCFGFSPALPQLLRLAGIESFFTIKVNWSETNRFPHDLFWWEGLDGSRVLAHSFDNPVGGYNGETSPRALRETWRNFRGKQRHPESLFSFGFGDGGGGPTEEMLQRQRQLDGFPVVPALRPVRVRDWFAAARQAAETTPATPVWVGEIYLELHRGTLTTQSRTKFLHRRAERALIAAETLGAMAAIAGAALPRSLEEHWRVLLRNQFHDILPGSSIREVYQRAEQELAAVAQAGRLELSAQLSELAQRIVPHGPHAATLVVNPDTSPRSLRLQADTALSGWQVVEGGSVACGPGRIPGLSAAVVFPASPPEGLTVSPHHLANAFVRIEIAPDGTLSRLWDARLGRDVLDGRGNQIWAYVDKPREWDAWDIEHGHWEDGEEVLATEPPEVVEHGPHRAAVRIVRRFRDSRIVQFLRLWANSPRLDIRTELDWHERRLLLKARFPLAIRSEVATYECAHGVVRRSTLRNTAWQQAQFEVASHRFADLSEQGYGVALLNDGKYGHHGIGNELGLTLLRSPIYPDPLADEGHQTFTYALLPHEGDWLGGGVLSEAEDLNQPLLHCRVMAQSEVQWHAVRLEGVSLALSGFKSAEDTQSLILRLYEPAGARGRVDLLLPEGWNLEGTVNLLEDPIGPSEPTVRPFEVRSLRLTRTISAS